MTELKGKERGDKIQRPLPYIVINSDSSGRGYRAFKSALESGDAGKTESAKTAFISSILEALAGLNPKLNTTIATEAEVEMWLMEENIIGKDNGEVLTFRSALEEKRENASKVTEETVRTREALGGRR